ncbi:MAG: DMT family transporter [Calditrichia bacterium]
MKQRNIINDLLLLLASVIWGFAFVAQRKGMEHIGPFLFNGIRFFLGALVLLPFIIKNNALSDFWQRRSFVRTRPFIQLGGLLFAGASLQQIGIVYTTAGKAGFITGLYVILVPILGIFIGRKTGKLTWMGAILAVVGMYFLSIKGDFSIAKGDVFVLTGAFFWAMHVLTVDKFANREDPILLAFGQFLFTSVLSLMVAMGMEDIRFHSIMAVLMPILYAGILSSGVAYTLQVVAQRKAHPSHAAIILSLESPFAALGGFLLLNEILSGRELFGCLLMLAGMLLSQAMYFKKSG